MGCVGGRIQGVSPPQCRYSPGGFVSERRHVFSNTDGGAGRFSAAFRGNSVGRSNETRKTYLKAFSERGIEELM